MSYQVFARKYRPLTFDDILGQEHVVKTLKNAIEQNRLAHAYLFVGPRGTGKTSTARIFAKALNCTGGPKIDFDPNEKICREIAEGNSLDVREIDGASNRGIDHIRDLCEELQFAPTGNFRIVYIDEVHMLTKESFNALLKTLEEPPPHVKFIFATTEPHKILPTILSRCQRFDLRPIPAEIIARHLLHIAAQERVHLSPQAAAAVAKVADGGMRDAQSMLDQLVSFCGNKIGETHVLQIFGITSRETVTLALTHILQKNLPSLLHLLNEQATAGRDMGQLLSDLIIRAREVLVAKIDPNVTSEQNNDITQQALFELIKHTPTDKILRLIEVLAQTDDKMRWSTNKKLHFEMGLIQAVHALMEVNISDIIAALDGAPLPAHTNTLSTTSSHVPSTHDLKPSIITSTGSGNTTNNDTAQSTGHAESQYLPESSSNSHIISSVQEQESHPTATQQTEVPVTPTALAPKDSEAQNIVAPIQIDDSPSEVIPTMPSNIEPGLSDVSVEQKTPIPSSESVSTEATIEKTSHTTAQPIFSVLSSAPVSPPEPEQSTDEDSDSFITPHIPNPEEAQHTGDFFDVLISTTNTSQINDSEISVVTDPDLQPAERHVLTRQDWLAVLDVIEQDFPLKVFSIRNGVFVEHRQEQVIIAFNPLDSSSIADIQSTPIQNLLESRLSERAGFEVTLLIQQDRNVELNVQEKLPPLPIPEPELQKSKKTLPKAVDAPPSPAPSITEPNNAYYNDPLIDEALKIFRARIIQ